MAMIQIRCTDDFMLGAYEAVPEGTCRGAVVVIQEVFGVNSHIRSVADGYAANGYYAVAPALFDRVERGIELGYAADDIEKGVDLAFSKLEMDTTLADIQATIQHAAGYGKVGIVGYCFGGLLTWLSACQLAGLSAAASYYGGGVPEQADMDPKCPTILHFGELDGYIPLDSVDAFKARHPELPVYMYPADHGFNCDQRDSYDAGSAEVALQRTLDLFAEHLA